MSNIAIFNPSQLPAFAKKGEMSAAAKALAGGAGQSGKRISIKGGVFRLMVDGKEVTAVEERYLDVVIVNTAPKVSRTFYAGVYDENKSAAPDCWSPDGDKPSPQSKDAQSASCATCPQNVKGSGQGDSRACRFSQRVAVLLANDIEGDVMQLSLAATSIFGKAEGENRPLQEHARFLMAQGVDPTMLVTRLRFDTKAPVPKLFFKPMRWLTEDEFTTCQEKGQSEEAIKAITMDVAAFDSAAASSLAIPGRKPEAKPAPAPVADDEADAEPPAAAPKKAKPVPAPVADDEDDVPAPAPKKAKAKPAPVPVDDDEDDAPAPEPKVRVAPAKAAPSMHAAGITATLAAWDDED